jgi:glycosyltransferase involved in cell wall biosynthesis
MQEKPVILQVLPHLHTGGVERTVIEVAEAIVQAGGVALVAAEPGRLTGELEAVGGTLLPFPAATKSPARILANIFRLSEIIKAHGVSLVHARSRAPAWSAYYAARQAGVPFVTTYHGVYNQKSALKAWYNSVMARGDMVIANSHYTAGIVRERHGTPEARLVVIHRGVDLERFDPQSVEPERMAALRAAWGVAPDARLVIMAGRLTRWKGQHIVIGAAAHIATKTEFDDVAFVLAGDDQGRAAYTQELRERIETLGLAGRVHLVGHCADMPAAFLTSSMAIVPSIEPEAFGRTSVEAQSMGCPVAVSDIGALPETFAGNEDNGGGRTGWSFPAGDEAELAKKIETILHLSPDVFAATRQAARVHAAEHFSKALLQSKTLRVYDSLLSSGLGKPFIKGLGAVDS